MENICIYKYTRTRAQRFLLSHAKAIVMQMQMSTCLQTFKNIV